MKELHQTCQLVCLGDRKVSNLGRGWGGLLLHFKDFQVVSLKCYTLQMVGLQLEDSKSLLKKSGVSPFPSIKNGLFGVPGTNVFVFVNIPLVGLTPPHCS